MVATVGTFDGVHAGHQALLAKTIERARDRGLRAVAVTWDRHPLQTLDPKRAPPTLTSPALKERLLLAAGVDEVVTIEFDEVCAALTAEAFVETVLVQRLNVVELCFGGGWRFGRGRSGDADLLRALGIAVTEIDRREFGAIPGSSTAVRRSLLAGDLDAAERLLGRELSLAGDPVSPAAPLLAG